MGAALAGLAWAGWGAVGDWRLERNLAWAKGELRSGRYEAARRWLLSLPSARRTDPEVGDLLGTCEHMAGHFEAALAAWECIPPGSPRAARAALARARTLIGDLGRYADAEVILAAALRQSRGPERVDVRDTLGQIYFNERRPDAMRRLLRAGWAESPRPAAVLRSLWMIDDATTLVAAVQAEMDRAASLAPEDDRVWLALAGLDTLTGRFDDAGRRLAECRRRRPDDPAVWRAWLDWARAADKPDELRRALDHLQADALAENDLLDLAAWLAARQGDGARERALLDQLIEREPGNARALERLSTLASQAGRSADAAAILVRKAGVDAAKDRYRRLLGERVPADHFAELAALAESLGRPFEARGWYRLASRRDPTNAALTAALDRLGREERSEPSAPAGTLADRLAGLLPGASALPVAPGRSVQALRAEDFATKFRDDAGPAGLRFVFDNGRSPGRQIPETSSGGVALLDYDGDGRLDVYALQGGPFPPDPARHGGADRLWRNRGDGTFEDVTARSGIGRLAQGYGHGVAVGDYDNDGRPDLFVTRWRSYALYHNRGDGTFEDMTARSGLGGGRDWPTSAAWADLDNDGDLDLYVCHYLVWDAEHPTLCHSGPELSRETGEPGPPGYCTPRQFPALPDHLFRNDGGRFTDVSDAAGITAADTEGRGFGVVAADLDDDGLIDLYVANDTTANYLFHNEAGLRFVERGLGSGAASNASGGFQAGMGTACGDLDGDGSPDLFVTNFYGESTTYFHNLGGGLFEDATGTVGLAAPSRFVLGFGIVLFDANNDGWLDLMTANGHVNDERPRFPYEMPAQLFVGNGRGRLTDVSSTSGRPWQAARVGRGLAAGDLDNDGRIDAVLVAQNAPLAFFHNESRAGHWVAFRLEGTTSNRDGVGARVTVSAAGRRRAAQRIGGGSFQSASDGRLHFGLGASTHIESVEVRWPSGQVDRWHDVEADTGYLLKEGAERPAPLAGFAGPRPRAADF